MRRCKTLSSVDAYQRGSLYGDVELQKARLVHVQLRTPKHPRWDTLSHSLPNVNLAGVNGVVLVLKDASFPYKTETLGHFS